MFKRFFSIALAAGMAFSMSTIALADTLELTDNPSEYSFVIADSQQKIHADLDSKGNVINYVTPGTVLSYTGKVNDTSMFIIPVTNGTTLTHGTIQKDGSLKYMGSDPCEKDYTYKYTVRENTVYDIMVNQKGGKWTNFIFSTVGQPLTGGQTNTKTEEKTTAPETAPKTTAPVTAAPTIPNVVAGSDVTYKVRSGDTFGNMCLNFYGDMQYHKALYAYNAAAMEKSSGKLFVGQTLVIPAEIVNGIYAQALPTAGAGEKLYTVKAGDTLGSIAAAELGKANRYNEIFNRNAGRIKDVNTIFEGQLIVLPVK